MKKIFLIFCFFVSALFSFHAKADTVLFCTTELRTGFLKKDGNWSIVQFVPDRYTVKFNRDFSQLSGLNKNLDYTCDWAYKDVTYKSVVCFSGFHSGEVFIYNIETKRFSFVSFQCSACTLSTLPLKIVIRIKFLWHS